MKLISFLLRSSPATVAVAVLAGLVAGLSNTGLLVLINAALNRAGAATAPLAWGFAGLCCAMLVSRGTSSVLLIRLSRWAVCDLRVKLCRRILAAPLRHLEELGASRLLATLTDDVPVIANALVTIPVLSMHFAVVATCLVYLGWLSWPVLVGVACFMLLGALSYQIPLARAHRFLDLSRQQWDALFKHFRALTEGVKELKLNRRRRETFLTDQLEATARSLRHNGFIGDTTYAIAASWGQLLVFILIGLLLFALPSVKAVDARTLTGYSLVILYLMTPLEVILNTLPVLGRADVAMQKVNDLGLSLERHSVEAAAARTVSSSPRFESLELVGVSHAYRREGAGGDDFMLGPVDLSFRPGEIVFLIGGNGSGKTTLAKLITGLYIPEGGEIRLNGRAVTDADRESYRQLFSTVFADYYLFESLIGLDVPGLDEQARRYLRQLQLDHKVRVKDGALSTTELSQGQRKRLALMTAYLEDRPVYLFDEWAADQDPQFKEIFYLHLLPELGARGKAVLVISHDDRYYHVADRLVKLDYGKVEESERIMHAAPVLVEA